MVSVCVGVWVCAAEALVRFLKAKLRVTQEEMDRLCQELSTKVLISHMYRNQII